MKRWNTKFHANRHKKKGVPLFIIGGKKEVSCHIMTKNTINQEGTIVSIYAPNTEYLNILSKY